MNFILTIDTEADNQWDHGRELTVENIKYVPRFQQLCNRYFIKPTYLVTSEVCEDGFSRDLFSDYIDNDLAEIGAHLHSWTTPPYLDKDGLRYNDINHAYANELPHDLLANKLRYLTDQIGTSFGKRPSSFRSGRYGFNENVARFLIANEYLVDSSVTPYVSWASHKGMPGNNGGPDFMNERPFPYRINIDDKSLLEIPVTIMPTKFPLNIDNHISKNYFKHVNSSMVLKYMRRLFFRHQPLWLRPYPWMDLDLLEDIINEADRIKLPYLVMIFHSSELMPESSIYRTDKDAIEKLFGLLERFFIMINYKKIASITLTEAGMKYNPLVSEKSDIAQKALYKD